MADARTVTAQEILEAAGWLRLNVCQDIVYDLWTDPLDPKGNRWFGRSAILEELRRRGAPASTGPSPPPTPPAPHEPPPSQNTREPAGPDDDLLF